MLVDLLWGVYFISILRGIAMNTVLPITAGSITSMTGLTKRPVFFLRMNGAAQPNLVVKGESLTTGAMNEDEVMVSIKWGSKLMKNVNNSQVNTKIMTANEVNIFRQAAAAAFDPMSPQGKFATNAFRWVKMPMVHGLSDADIFNEDIGKFGSYEIGLIRKLLPKLFNDNVWRDLGPILAADIFSGNSDRFNVTTGTWNNYGNLMFLAGGTTSMIGLDTFDPNSGDEGNLANKGGFDAMQSLIDPNRRNAFALACTKSVGEELSDKAVRAGAGGFVVFLPAMNETRSLAAENLRTAFVPYANLLAQGIADGADTLRAYLQGKVQQYAPVPNWRPARPEQRVVIGGGGRGPRVKNLPQGVLDRMAHLGW